MLYEEELKALQERCKKEVDRCYAMDVMPGLDDTPSLEAKKIFREYNRRLLALKEKYNVK